MELVKIFFNKNFSQENQDGFTLIEIVVTSAISSFLCLGVAQVIVNNKVQTTRSTSSSMRTSVFENLKKTAMDPNALIVSSWQSKFNPDLNACINPYAILTSQGHQVMLSTSSGCPNNYQRIFITTPAQQVPVSVCYYSLNGISFPCASRTDQPFDSNNVTWTTPITQLTVTATCVAALSTTPSLASCNQPKNFSLYGANGTQLAAPLPSPLGYNHDGTHCANSPCAFYASSSISLVQLGPKSTYSASISGDLRFGDLSSGDLKDGGPAATKSFQPMPYSGPAMAAVSAANHQDLSVSLSSTHGLIYSNDANVSEGSNCMTPNRVVLVKRGIMVCVNGIWKLAAQKYNPCPKGNWVVNPTNPSGPWICQYPGSSCPSGMTEVSPQITTTQNNNCDRSCNGCVGSCGEVLVLFSVETCGSNKIPGNLPNEKRSVSSGSHSWGSGNSVESSELKDFAACGCGLALYNGNPIPRCTAKVTEIGCY